jgi:peptidoglycan/LPS O-acetylase OafA/YrhL
MTLGQVFDPRNNALNTWRLVLAAEVILWHSIPLTGRLPWSQAVHQLCGDLGVDGFFAISGFLVTSSWLRHPHLREYSVARGLRIFPGFWVCLIVIAFVIAPIGVAVQGGSAVKLLLSSAPIEYVVRNSAVAIVQNDIAGTPSGIPHPGYWNGSLWTLIWELFCYIAVAVFGVVGLLNRRWLLPVLLALAFAVLLPTLWSPPNPDMASFAQVAARFGIMFLAGALVHQFRNVIPARWPLVAVSAIIVLISGLLPDYHVVAALPLAYAIIASGALIHDRRFRLSTDLSYGMYIYAFPIQQLLVIGGLASLNPIVFFALATTATLPLAALSWYLVEKPAMSLKSRLIGRAYAATARL